MKLQLKRTLIEQVQVPAQFQVKKLTLEGIELEEILKCYLSRFTVGILDPDIAGKKPDRFVFNLQNGILGDFSNRYIITAQDDNNDAIGILIGLPEAEHRLHIYSLHVSPEYRSKGVGSTLLSRCINDMCISNVKEIILDVHIDNKPAYKLYKKFDFIETNNDI
jgi:ribosomal protein S18 acetylase RimI-like enzyme